MTSIFEKAGGLWPKIWGLLRTRRETAPIDSVSKLIDFVGSRSAYIAQKTLYGYVKTRMGINYPAMFEDDKIIASLDIAKLHVFAACLSDLTIYAVGTTLHDQPVGNDARREISRRCHEAALHEIVGDAEFSAPDCIEEFKRRLDDTDWRSGAMLPDNFSRSPQALFRWAPVADELKKFDGEIIENSIKYAWRDIREQFQKRIDAAGVYADWSHQSN